MATEDDKIDTGALATVVAVGTAGMIGISLAVNALVRHEMGAVGAGRDEVGADAYRTIKKEQLDKLSAPAAWADQGKGQVAIPIDRAMGLVLADLKRNPWSATPAPPPDAGADAAAETAPEAADAGADGAAAPESDAGAAPEPSGSAPLSPGVPPAPQAPGSGAPAPTASAPRVLPPPTVPPVAPPPASAPAQPTPPPTQPTRP